MRNHLLIALLLLTGSFAFAQGPEVVIPRPSEVILSEGVYTYGQEPSVKVSYVKGKFGPEEYQISITKRGVKVKVSSAAGEFYALQTLAQMTQQGNVKQLQCCEIKDAPRFPYRGLHVDVSRHFRSLDFLKKQIDAMAMFKMNRIHLHLTDAAGWRVHIDSYPRLTSFAAWRPYNNWKEFWFGDRLYCEQDDPKAKGGYYTQEEVKEVVAYGQKLNITINPEIEMPGHSDEVLGAYPEYSCKGKPYTSGEICIGNENTYTFLTDILSEVIELFPSEYIHIGGDEADHKNWKDCPK